MDDEFEEVADFDPATLFSGPKYPEGTIHDTSERLKYVNERSESPIEHKLAWALLFSQKFVVLPDAHAEAKLHHYEFGFVMQHRVGPYRLDMALFVHPRSGGLKKVAIECDGEKFHTGPLAERRDQIRDAYLRRQGFEVWRYAGWMLFHASDAAADEIHRAAEALAEGKEPLLTFTLNRKDKRPTLAEYEAAFWSFDFGGPWPERMGKNPKQRGWRTIEDLFDWARHDSPHRFPELEDDE